MSAATLSRMLSKEPNKKKTQRTTVPFGKSVGKVLTLAPNLFTSTSLRSSRDSSSTPYPGLKNLGNTCYMNCVLQVLFHCPQFRTELAHLCLKFRQEDSRNVEKTLCDSCTTKQVRFNTQHHRSILNALCTLYEEMDQEKMRKINEIKQNGVVFNDKSETAEDTSLVEFISSVGLVNDIFSNTRQQQDVQEFLRFLLSSLQDLEISSQTCEHKKLVQEDSMETEESSSSSTTTPPSKKSNQSKKRRISELLAEQNSFQDKPSKTRRMSKTSKNAEQSQIFLTHYRQSHFSNFSNQDGEKNQSFVQQLFQGKINSTTKCLTCHNENSTVEPFFDLSLNIEKEKGLMWSFDQFVATERLQGQNKYKCEKCKTMTEAERSLKFSSLPPVLTIHLKRFSYDKFRQKVTCHVDCPMNLNLDSFSTTQCQGYEYELFGIILHKGNFPSCGHYVTVLKVPPLLSVASDTHPHLLPFHEPQWLFFDDDHTSFLSEEKVIELISSQSQSSNTAYILFYQRKGLFDNKPKKFDL